MAQCVLSSNNIQSSIYQVSTVCHIFYLAGAYRKLGMPLVSLVRLYFLSCAGVTLLVTFTEHVVSALHLLSH